MGLSTSRSGSLEFMLGCKLLLELRMLFAFDEMTDSKLELMMLFLCSSGGEKRATSPILILFHRDSLSPHTQKFTDNEILLRSLSPTKLN